MPPTWKNSDKARRVITRLDELCDVNEEGNVAYPDFGTVTRFDAGVEVLVGLAQLRDDLPQSERRQFVRQGVIEAKKAGDLTATRVLKEIEDHQIDFLRRPEHPYVLMTSLSLRYFGEFSNVQAYGARMTFTENEPERFERPDAPWRDSYEIPNQFTTVRVHVHAQNAADAVEAALDRLNFIRGLWSYALTYGQHRITFQGYKPANDIVPGPIYSLHNPDGSPATGTYWLNPNYSPNLRVNDIRSKYDLMKDWEGWARERVSKANFEDRLRQLIIRYGQALDETDPQSAFLRLWGVLEELSGLTKNERLTTAVDRTAVLSGDPDYDSLVLNRLRSIRNDIVHRGRDPEQAERLMYALKRYVDALLRYVLSTADEWNDLQDFGAFLSTVNKADDLRNHRYYDLALDLLSAR